MGVEHDELVLVPDATQGINTVLRNFEWKEGDVIVDGRSFSALYTEVI